MPYAWEALLAWAPGQRPRHSHTIHEVSSGECTCEVSFALIFLIATACFAQRACDFVHEQAPETGASPEKWPLPPHRHITFHALACVSVLAMAMAHAFVAADVQSPGLVPWRYNGRLAVSAFLAISIGYVNGRQMSDICPALALAAGAWAQLGAAATPNMEAALHWGLAVSGVFMGAVALHILYGFVDQCLFDTEELSRRDMVDLALFCNMSYLLLWLVEVSPPLMTGYLVESQIG